MSDLTPKTKPPDFAEITRLIESARQRAYQAVNTALIELYWQVGAYLSAKIKAAEWGEGVIEQLARHLASTQPGLRGFSAQNIWRMRQFHEAYHGQVILSPLLRELPWTHNLIILSRGKRPEEREFYLKMAAQEKWSAGSWSGSLTRSFLSGSSSARQKCHHWCDKFTPKRPACSKTATWSNFSTCPLPTLSGTLSEA
jgi:predicted nuclease of restriction endonuclease-like (RecB) superfamily